MRGAHRLLNRRLLVDLFCNWCLLQNAGALLTDLPGATIELFNLASFGLCRDPEREPSVVLALFPIGRMSNTIGRLFIW